MTAIGIALLDQATKWLALTLLSPSDRVPLLGGLLGLQLAFNPGTILSLGSGATWMFTLVGIGAILVLPVVAGRARTDGSAATVGLIWGGAAGNLVDRLFAPPRFGYGHVTDFLAYGDLFIGNLADVALAIGIITAVLLRLRSDRPRTRRSA